MPSVLVTTPTGHIGSRVAEQLVAAGTPTRVFVRDPGRLAPAVAGRADVRTGSLDDAGALSAALDGVDAAFLLIPPNYAADDWRAAYRRFGEAAVEAVRRAGTTRVVFLSSQGAHRDDLGPVSWLGEIEQLLRDAAPHVVALRPAYFFENVFAALPTIGQTGTIFGHFAPDVAFPQVATRDIGDVAARWLQDPSWTGHPVAGVHGPRDLSMGELAELTGEALGRPVAYAPVPLEAVAQGMAASGMTPSVVEGYLALLGGLARTQFDRAEPRTAETTTPTEYGSWARDTLRPAAEAMQGAAAPAGAGAA